MKKILVAALIVLVGAVSCSPSRYALSVELSSTSKSGIDLSGKNISVSYMAEENSTDSLFLASAAESFAQSLEEDYYKGEEAIGIFKVDADPDIDNTSKDGMVNLVVDTGVDVAFLFDAVSEDYDFEMRLYVYDSMDEADTVRVFLGRGVLSAGGAETHGQKVGAKSAEYFTPTWVHSRFNFYYYTTGKWYTALEYVDQYKFAEAIDVWLELVDNKNLYKRSMAEYNIAAACFICGQKSLAEQWLDRSDAHYKLPESAVLRKKFNR